jgi:hypothetical protein
VTVVCVALTRLITHVDRDAVHEIGVAFRIERPAGSVPITVANLLAHRFEMPRLALTDYNEMLIIIPPGTTSITVYGAAPFEMSCAYSDEVQIAAALPTFLGAVRKGPLTSIADRVTAAPQTLALGIGTDSTILATRRVWGTLLRVPPSVRAKLQRTPLAQAVVRCSFAQSIVAAPTFSGRSVIVAVVDTRTGTVALDMSAFDGVDGLRFGGGVATANGGDQLRILDAQDRLVRVEWNDEAALEERDIILVLIGGLAAVAAATFIESLRPVVKSRAVPGDAPRD